MKRARWAALVLVAAAGAFLVLYSFRKARPDIPADAEHLAARANPEACLACHGKGGSSPRSPNHPMGRDCGQCHYWEGEAR